MDNKKKASLVGQSNQHHLGDILSEAQRFHVHLIRVTISKMHCCVVQWRQNKVTKPEELLPCPVRVKKVCMFFGARTLKLQE